MAITLRGVPTVLLPGTGSDDDYVYRVFAGPLHEMGAVVIAAAPQPDRLVAGYVHALEEASHDWRHRGGRGVHRCGGGGGVGAGSSTTGRRGAGRATAVDR